MTSLKKAALAGLCSLAVFSVGTAHATPLISLGLSQDASTPATIATNSGTGSLSFNQAFGTFSDVNVSATGVPLVPQATFKSTSIDTKSTQGGAQTLYIWITAQGLTQPASVANFLSGFTANIFSGNVSSVTETTYISATNQLFGGVQHGDRDVYERAFFSFGRKCFSEFVWRPVLRNGGVYHSPLWRRLRQR